MSVLNKSIEQKEPIVSDYFGVDLSQIGEEPFRLDVSSIKSNNGFESFNMSVLNSTGEHVIKNAKGDIVFYTNLNTFKQKNKALNLSNLMRIYPISKTYTKDELIHLLYDFILYKRYDLPNLTSVKISCRDFGQGYIELTLSLKLKKRSDRSFNSMSIQQRLKTNQLNVMIQSNVKKQSLLDYFRTLDSFVILDPKYQDKWSKILQITQTDDLCILIQDYINQLSKMGKEYKTSFFVRNSMGKINLLQQFITEIMEKGDNFYMNFFDIANYTISPIVPILSSHSSIGPVVVSPHQGTENNGSIRNAITIAHKLTKAGIEGNDLDKFQQYAEQLHNIDQLTINAVIKGFKNQQIAEGLGKMGSLRVNGGKKRKTVRKKSKTQKPKSKRS